MNPVTKKWLFLKISSLILIPLMFWFIINFVSLYDNDYQSIVGFSALVATINTSASCMDEVNSP